MTKQAYFFQKFQKKYLFFQQSFFDFLYWRSQNSTSSLKKTNFALQKEGEENKFYPLEQEKICFQNYWKISEQKKSFQYFEKATHFSKNSFFSDSALEEKIQKKEKNFFFEKKRKLKLSQRKRSSLDIEKNVSFHGKKNKGSLVFSTEQNKKNSFFASLNFKKRKKSNFVQNKNFRLQKSNFSKRFEYLKIKKIGNFFPQKKHFQQYWIFPFVGFFIFFSRTSDFTFFSKHIHAGGTISPFFTNFSEKEKHFCERKTKNFQQKKPALTGKTFHSQKSLQPFEFDFSYADHEAKKMFDSFQALEKSEFEVFLQFSKKILSKKIYFLPSEKKDFEQLNSFYLLPFHSKFSKEKSVPSFSATSNSFLPPLFSSSKFVSNPFSSQELEFGKSSPSKTDEIFAQTEKKNHFSVLPRPDNQKDFGPLGVEQNFQKRMESQRNSLNWKWFSFMSNSNFSKTTFFEKFFHLKLPQKAQFLSSEAILANKEKFFSFSNAFQESTVTKDLNFENVKKNKASTPLFDFSQNLFCADEIERNLSFANQKTSLSSVFQKQNFLKLSPLSGENFEFLNFFLPQNQTKKSSFFFRKEISKKNFETDFFLHISNSFCQFEPSLVHQAEKTKINSKQLKKNVLFLKNWKKIQKFSTLQKKNVLNLHLQKKDGKILKNKDFSPKVLKSPKLTVFKNLDGLFFQKLFQTSLFSLDFVNSSLPSRFFSKSFVSPIRKKKQGEPIKFLSLSETRANLNSLQLQQDLQAYEKIKNDFSFPFKGEKTFVVKKNHKFPVICSCAFKNFFDFQKRQKVYKKCEKFVSYSSFKFQKGAIFPNFKKQTFQFFLFHSYHTHSKKLLNFNRIQKTNLFEFQENTQKNDLFFSFFSSSKKKKLQTHLIDELNGFQKNEKFNGKEMLKNFQNSKSSPQDKNHFFQFQSPILFHFSSFPEEKRTPSSRIFKFIERTPTFQNEKGKRFSTLLNTQFFPNFKKESRNLPVFGFEFLPKNTQKTVFEDNFESSSFEKMPFFKRWDSRNFLFSFPKLNFFEKLVENFSFSLKEYETQKRNFEKSFLFKHSVFDNFEKAFLFEKGNFQKPLVFQNQKHLLKNSLRSQNSQKVSSFVLQKRLKNEFLKKSLFLEKKNSFFSPSRQKKVFAKSISNRFLLIKLKRQKNVFFQPFSNGTQMKYKLSSFHQKSRKFEKVFQTFFSPLQDQSISAFTKNKKRRKKTVEDHKDAFLNSFSTNQDVKKQNFKRQNDISVLKSLSFLLKKNSKTFNLYFFKSFPQNLKENNMNSFDRLFFEKNQNSYAWTLRKKEKKKKTQKNFCNQIQPSFIYMTKNEKPLFEKGQSVRKKYRLSAQFLLKRDGFLFLGSLPDFFRQTQDLKFDHVGFENESSREQLKKRTSDTAFAFKEDESREIKSFLSYPISTIWKQVQIENQTKQDSAKFRSIQRLASAESFQRLEKEKLSQKKRRLKKQKLETRRRKKRKRFFPRPIWLRINLYKKFLQNRHGKQIFSIPLVETENKNSINKKNSASMLVEFLTHLNSKSEIQPFQIQGKPNENGNFQVFGKNDSSDKNREFIFLSKFQKNQKEKRNFLKNSVFLPKPLTLRDKAASGLFFSEKERLKSGKSKNPSVVLKQNSNFQTFESSSLFLKNQNCAIGKKIYRKNQQKWGSFWKNGFQEKHAVKKLFLDSRVFQKYQNDTVSKNIENYKISGEIFREFLRFSWKSSWFHTQFQPYTKTIQANFKKIQSIESKKNFSSFPFTFQGNSVAFPQFFKNCIFQEQNPNDFLFRKAVFQKFLWYANIQTSLTSNRIEKNSLNFQKIQNLPEYNRILYERVSELLRDVDQNFQYSENTDGFLFKNFKVPRRKNETIFSSSNSSFFTKSALFFEKFCIPSQPAIPAFSIFSSLFQDSSIKPTGEIPTLRALWAFQKTNLFHFQETNAVRNFWTFKKRKDRFKSFKGTKKFMSIFRKYIGFERMKFQKLKNLENLTLLKSLHVNFFKENFKKENFSLKQKISDKTSFSILSKIDKNAVFEPSEKTSFLRIQKSNFFDFLNQLDSLTLKKFQNAEQKSLIFGIQSLQQNSKISFRYFKFHFSKYQPVEQLNKTSSSTSELQKPAENLKESHLRFFQVPDRLERQKNIFCKIQQKSAKSSLNFWWAQKNFQGFDFFNAPQTSVFHQFSFEKQTNFLFDSFESNLVRKKEQNDFLPFSIQILWFGTFVFHLAIFSTFFKLPEIRSIFKFQFLIFSKLFKSFCLVFFGTYNILKKYIQTGEKLLQTVCFPFNEDFLFSSDQQTSFFKSTNLLFFSRIHFLQEFQFEFLEKKANLSNSRIQKKEGQKSFFLEGLKNKKSREKSFLFEFFPRLSNFSSKVVLLTFKKQKFENQISLFYISEKTSQKSSSSTLSRFILNPYIFLDKEEGGKRTFNQQNFNQTFQKINGIQFFSKNWTKAFFQKKKKIEKFNSFYRVSSSSFLKLSGNFFEQQKKLNLKNKQPSSMQTLSKGFESFRSRKKFPLQNQKLTFQAKYFSKGADEFALSFLILGKSIALIPYSFLQVGSKISTKIFEIFESFFFTIYKFLEKPAELMIEFIAFIFLIEWSSDIITFFPDTVESSFWKSSQKIIRPIRSGSLFFSSSIQFLGGKEYSIFTPFGISGLPFTDSSSLSQMYLFHQSQRLNFNQLHNFSMISNFTGPFAAISTIGIFTYFNFLAFLFEKRLFYFFEFSLSSLMQPDMDILVRQRKGMIFWDIWAEILLKAAEKYNVNIPSFVTLKEEQELFLEKLLQDSVFFESFQRKSSKTRKVSIFDKFSFLMQQKKANIEKENYSSFLNQKYLDHSFHSFLQNFLVKDRPQSWFDLSFLFEFDSLNAFSLQTSKTKMHQFSLLKKMNFQPLSFENFGTFEKNSSSFQHTKNQTLLFSSGSFFLQSHSSPDEYFFHNFGKSSLPLTARTIQDRWACSQYATSQSQETDFFLDIYPPKSLKHIHFLKYYEPAQYTLGSIICQIYSGTFSKQVSKNILVVGEAGRSKTFFLQALAGETEMKIITENAARYALVQRGVAVGMKYLRDVFDAIALQTPCFFVMEDLHIIGSKRPFLISDNENGKALQSSFGLEQQEVHETNQMVYQLNRHSIVDFQRPYKGDFSMGIPTNFFLQTFYTSAEKNSSSLEQFQNSQFSGKNFNSNMWNSLSSPLPIDSLDALMNQATSGIGQDQAVNPEFKRLSMTFKNSSSQKKKIESCLQLAKQQVFAPPATSPFTVLMMKEQKKLKPKKIVQEISWGGLSADQMISYQKENSSVRAKVAILADKTLNLSRGKFDMITDFLVIIDNVRSNRGFIVFGTTHSPSLLDPALRRPGRFDETLALSQSPNFLNRFEIFQMNFENSSSTFDFLDSSLLTENLAEIDILNLLTQTKLSFFHQYKYSLVPPFLFKNSQISSHKMTKKNKKCFSQTSLLKAFLNQMKSSFFSDFYLQKPGFLSSGQKNTLEMEKKKNLEKKSLGAEEEFDQKFSDNLKSNKLFVGGENEITSSKAHSFFFLRNLNLLKYPILPKGPSHLLSLTYSKIGIFLAESKFLKEPTACTPLRLDISKNFLKTSTFRKNFYTVFYESKKHQSLHVMMFLSGKIAEFFNCGLDRQNLQTSNVSIQTRDKFLLETPFQKAVFFSSLDIFQQPADFFSTKFGIFDTAVFDGNLKQTLKNQKINVTSSPSNSQVKKFLEFQQNFQVFTKIHTFQSSQEKKFENLYVEPQNLNRLKSDKQANFMQNWTAYGTEDSWQSATPFLFSIIRKRFLFTKNLILSKMLFFENNNQRRKPPSPPSSSILMPAKKYENFKRAETDFYQKGRFSINEKIQMHQKQRFLKQLYNIPVQYSFQSQFRKNHQSFFGSSFQELAYLDSFVQTSSSSSFYQKKYIQLRHRFTTVNQWWTGMFPEHNRESTYLSDVDWRTMFVSEKGISKEKNLDSGKNKKKQFEEQTFEFLMDFPDADQYYNPRNRRWYFNSNRVSQLDSSNRFLTESNIQQGDFLSRSKNTTQYKSMQKNFDHQKRGFWLTFDKEIQYEIFYHFLTESFHQSFSYFDQQREMLDFFVFSLLCKGSLKEFDFLTTFSRFKKKSDKIF